MSLGIEEINQCNETHFVELLGGVFEHSPWVPELVFGELPFASRRALHAAMCKIVRNSPKIMRLELLCRHPELAGKEASAGTLTDDSKREQAGAGLDQCSIAELATINSLNQDYSAKFEFPFIIAVTGLDKHQIIESMQKRLDNSTELEFETALTEVEKIARIRIDALIDA
ncbi:MAG: 2-oxo-4-hydroxy-4-carboxy-5-ureidoimidazoline decarboxylase [Gammaproteobacteria bacterium]|nr:2-oxo-4-hydroxy-4-carboxy-5-ureidoimidazoline decarboxylase [Gammaproteobacteria bacterium]